MVKCGEAKSHRWLWETRRNSEGSREMNGSAKRQLFVNMRPSFRKPNTVQKEWGIYPFFPSPRWKMDRNKGSVLRPNWAPSTSPRCPPWEWDATLKAF